MDQRERNRQEWENPDNWRGFSWSAFYFGERDTRLFPPKRNPRLGWTINFGHPAGRFVLLGFLGLAFVVVVLVLTTR